MTGLYSDIEQKNLRWLDRCNGKTGAAITADAATAVAAWLPDAIKASMEEDKTYIMTLESEAGYEVVGITKSAGSFSLKRGMEGTIASAWPQDSNIFQAFTASQLRYLMAQAAKVVEPEPEATHQLAVGHHEDGAFNMYGYSVGDSIGSISPVDADGLGDITAIAWMNDGAGDISLMLYCSDWTGGSVSLAIGGTLLEVPRAGGWGTYIELTQQQWDSLPKAGLVPVVISVA